MAKFSFTATHGVTLGVPVWAKFERSRELDTPEGEKRYVFETSSSKIAARLRSVDGYGIVETSKVAEVPTPVAPVEPATPAEPVEDEDVAPVEPVEAEPEAEPETE